MTQSLPASERVVIDKPETMNLLGLLMKGLLTTNLANERKYSLVKNMKGDVQVGAGRMTITMRFGEGRLTILCGSSDHPNAHVGGTMTALLGVVLGKGMVSSVLTGKIKFGGNLFMLLKMLPLIQEPKS